MPDLSACQHPRTEIRRKTDRNGNPMYCKQCMTCGSKASNWISPNALDVPAAKVHPWDAELEDTMHRAMLDQIREAREHENPDTGFWDDYNTYLKSEAWQSKRQRVLKRDPICQACHRRPAAQVHHLNYRHVFDEPLFDLVGVCVRCHRKITSIDRKRRAMNRETT